MTVVSQKEDKKQKNTPFKRVFSNGALVKPLFLVFFLFLQGLCDSWGQSGSVPSEHDNLIFKMAVFGPSDEIYIWWGHAALIVENTEWNYSRIFDWGIFSYPSDNFLWDFIHNEVSYKCAVGPARNDIDMYISEDRDIIVYTLDLDREGKDRILKYAENNTLSENCYYQYHQFRDNCSTGIRRLIDMGTGGQFREKFENLPGRFTYREHVRRFIWFRPLADWFLGFLMGQTLDEQISVWEEMFLPVELARNMVDFRYADHAGLERKLVSSIELLNQSKNRPPVLNAPRNIWTPSLVLGLFAGVFFLLLGVLREKLPPLGRIIWGLAQSVLGFFLGAAGTVLFYGEFIIPDDYIRQNINLLFVNPLLFVMVPLGICAAFDKPCRLRPEKCLRILWTYECAALILSLLIKGLPFFHQQNQPVQCLLLPAAAVLSCPLWGSFLKALKTLTCKFDNFRGGKSA